jgi:hypothetical protein
MIRESQDYKAVAVFRLLHRADDRNANARDVALDQLYCSVRGPAFAMERSGHLVQIGTRSRGVFQRLCHCQTTGLRQRQPSGLQCKKHQNVE